MFEGHLPKWPFHSSVSHLLANSTTFSSWSYLERKDHGRDCKMTLNSASSMSRIGLNRNTWTPEKSRTKEAKVKLLMRLKPVYHLIKCRLLGLLNLDIFVFADNSKT